MPRFSIIDAPSILGLKPTGVEHLPEALKVAGLQTGLNAEYAGRVEPLPYNPQRDPETLILNPDALRTFSLRLAEAVADVLQQGKFPLVLGGDCSNIIWHCARVETHTLTSSQSSSLNHNCSCWRMNADKYLPVKMQHAPRLLFEIPVA
jgi:arginase family enzyme